jgi:uncharacterized glyoxalase superfamily protein PhnB
MALSDDARAPNIFPVLSYADAPAAIEWLVTTFGFEAVAIYPGMSGTIDQAELRLGPGWIMLSSIQADATSTRTPREDGAGNQGIAIYVQDVDRQYERARAAGAEIVLGIRDTHYGARDYMVRDSEGHCWSVGNYRPGAPVEV